ncbi:hypothetical protein DFS34DRAFT_374802 [Phlyctochytrium arcticum]|nr:hypothetical protein DFS34DRAFT_374802 [Phlyctochytrium arcticum]
MAESSSAGGGPQQQQHLLSLKVMRLSRPSFVSVNPIPFEDRPDFPAHAALVQAAENDITAPSPLKPEPQPAPVVDLLGDSPVADTAASYGSDAASNNLIRDFGLSELLQLPSSFGNIYLGETFSSYLCINNESGHATHDVGMKAELQTGSQRFVLADTLTSTPKGSTIPSINYSSMLGGNSGGGSSLGSGSGGSPGSGSGTIGRIPLLPTQSAEFVINHEIKELGVHILVCSVHYSTGSLERKHFRKFYKFQVLNPLTVKTKVNSLQDGRVFLEAQVQNVANELMYLERMRFDPNDLFSYRDLNTVQNTINATPLTTSITKSTNPLAAFDIAAPLTSTVGVGATEDGAIYLDPQDTRQYLYMLYPKKPQDSVARTTASLGKLDIMWRTHLGHAGRLQTSQLSRKVPVQEPYDLQLIATPEHQIRAEVPFTVTCRIRNNLVSETLRLTLHGVKQKMSSVLLVGASERAFGSIGPLEWVDFQIQLFPLLAGLHKIGGFKISEMVSGTSREIENLGDVYVWQTA